MDKLVYGTLKNKWKLVFSIIKIAGSAFSILSWHIILSTDFNILFVE